MGYVKVGFHKVGFPVVNCKITLVSLVLKKHLRRCLDSPEKNKSKKQVQIQSQKVFGAVGFIILVKLVNVASSSLKHLTVGVWE